jgi:hypothetical protein
MLLGYGEKSAVPDPGRNSLPPLKLGATQVSLRVKVFKELRDLCCPVI